MCGSSCLHEVLFASPSKDLLLEVCILGRVKCSSDRVTFGNFVIIVNPHLCLKDIDGIFVAGNLYWDPGIYEQICDCELR